VADTNSPGEEHGPELTVQEARQGRSGRPIVLVLAVSLILVVIAFAAVWLYHAPGFAGPGGQTQVSGKATSAPLKPPRQKLTDPRAAQNLAQ
jgi:hypothetical protein